MKKYIVEHIQNGILKYDMFETSWQDPWDYLKLTSGNKYIHVVAIYEVGKVFKK